jgi:hypothetical protein
MKSHAPIRNEAVVDLVHPGGPLRVVFLDALGARLGKAPHGRLFLEEVELP